MGVYELFFFFLVSTSWFFGCLRVGFLGVYELVFSCLRVDFSCLRVDFFFVYECGILSTSRSVYELVCLRVDRIPSYEVTFSVFLEPFNVV